MTMCRARCLLSWIALAVGLVFGQSGTASAQSCTFGLTAPVFGSVNLLTGAANDTFGSMTVSCTGTANASVQVCPNFGAGTGGASGDGSVRFLKSGGNQIGFNYFQDAARSVVWGSTLGDMGATQPPSVIVPLNSGGTGNANLIVYARLFGGQSSALIGAYASSVPANIRYAYNAGGGCATVNANAATANMITSANYAASCLLSTTNLNFGTILSLSAPLDRQSNLSLTCSNGMCGPCNPDGGGIK